jgi:response regulator of citrate/malate metabolism
MDYANPANIMIIDDDEINNFIVEKLIKKVCKITKITTCTDTTNAIDLLLSINKESGRLPEFIFLELFSPSMNGWDFLAEYSRLNLDKIIESRIIILTCSIFQRDIDLALNHTCVIDYITKPVTTERLKSLFAKSCSALL